MKVLLIAFCLIFISCGGSSGGGSSDGDTPNCKSSACGDLNPAKPTGSQTAISNTKAENMLRQNQNVFEDIRVGLDFLEVQKCKDDKGTFSERMITNLTVLEFDKEKRTIKYRVKVLSAQPNNQTKCLYNEYEGDLEYVLIRELPKLEDAIKDLDFVQNYYLTQLNNRPFLLGSGTRQGQYGYSAKIEVGINLSKSYPTSFYLISDIFYKDTFMYKKEEFSLGSGFVDINTIDTTNLNVYYTSSTHHSYQIR